VLDGWNLSGIWNMRSGQPLTVFVTANRSFYLKFKVDRQTTQGRLLYELGGGDWDIPGLRTMLEKLLPERR